jgi:hypothetical protein
VVTSGLEILSSLKDIFSSIASGIKVFKDVFTTSFVKVGDFFSKTLTTFIKETFTISNIGQQIFSTVISIPTTITISRGLEFMGMDPRFARIATSFMSGGFFADKMFTFSLANALEGLAIQGVTELENRGQRPFILIK